MKKLTNDPRFLLISAFAAVYFIWGSTYLAIRLLTDTLPGFTMVGLRFVLAGAILYAWARARGAEPPTARQARASSTIGVLLLTVGTGAVVWAVGYLDSGLVALLVATEPLWVALLLFLWPEAGPRSLGPRTLLALGIGFCGTAILASPGRLAGEDTLHLPAVLLLMVGCLSWAAGSLYSRRAELPASGWVHTAIQMLAGGAALLVLGTARGELAHFDPAGVSLTSLAAFLYLVLFGSLVAFSAYAWLIRTNEPTLVATHTYVNPVVALFLGWWIAGETFGPRAFLASALILVSVVLLTLPSRRLRTC
jgi:drug/metabolite transporter (DMT)-like permease